MNVINQIELFEQVGQSLQYQPTQPPEFEKQRYEMQLRIEEASIKKMNAEKIAIEAMKQKMVLKEQYAEKKRALVEVLEVDNSGEVVLITKNVSFDSIPRKVTNLKTPKIMIYRSLSDPEIEYAYMLYGKIAERNVNIWLSPKKIAKGNYLEGKLLNAGVIFEIQKQNRLKQILSIFIGKLIDQCEGELFLPDMPGWYQEPNGRINFIREGGLTWSRVKKLI